MNHRHPDADPDVYPTAKQERDMNADAYKKDVIDPLDLVGSILGDAFDGAVAHGKDPTPLRELLDHAESVRIDLGGEG